MTTNQRRVIKRRQEQFVRKTAEQITSWLQVQNLIIATDFDEVQKVLENYLKFTYYKGRDSALRAERRKHAR